MKDPLYTLKTGKSGRGWLYPVNILNGGDYILCTDSEDWDIPGEGFGGDTLVLPMEYGGMFYLYGGWASNSETLLTDTGVDLTQSHNTQCVLRMNLYDYNGEVILMEVYREKFPILGSLYRPEQIAEEWSSKFDCPVLLTSISFGGKVEKWVGLDRE